MTTEEELLKQPSERHFIGCYKREISLKIGENHVYTRYSGTEIKKMVRFFSE